MKEIKFYPKSYKSNKMKLLTIYNMSFLLATTALTCGCQSSPPMAKESKIKRTELQRHDLSVPGRESVQVRIDFEPGAAFGRHTHPGEEVIYVIEGVFEYEVEGKPVTLKAGDVLFIPAGTVHAAKNVGTTNAAELATYIVEKGKQLVVLDDATTSTYPNMPVIAPIGEQIAKYITVNESAKGPSIDPGKGYRLQELGKGLYMVTDNIYQSMFMEYENGVVVVDAPPIFAQHITKAIAGITNKPITHVVYSHAHIDHIGGTKALNLSKEAIIIAHEETKQLLTRAGDPNRPIPTVTFKDRYALKVGSQILELSYHGNAHVPGNIFIYAPEQKTLMVVDVVFPGWMPWRRFALAQDIPAYFRQVETINKMKWDVLVSGHVERTGTHADVALQIDFMNDLKNTARKALRSTKPGEGLDAADKKNPWAIFDNYIDRVVIQCVNALTPRWSTKLAGFDVYIWDQCYAMEQSLRIDEE
jgi:quercetin dioxygenase-like cupin family protein/glyoxylase-like metal-dependent hydrolase (beta-lactamase superfamily II)